LFIPAIFLHRFTVLFGYTCSVMSSCISFSFPAANFSFPDEEDEDAEYNHEYLARIHKRFTHCRFCTAMDPNEFLFLVLPLASLVALLVAVVFCMARRENTIHHKELETLNELMRTGEVDNENVSMVLEGLVSKKVIDEKSRERLRKLLEKSL
jgi:hypothetical protein